MANGSGGWSVDNEMDLEWTRIKNSRKGGGKGKADSQTTVVGKRALEEAEDGKDVRKKAMMEEFKVVLKFGAGNEIVNVSLIAITTGLRKAIGDIEMSKVQRDGSLLIV